MIKQVRITKEEVRLCLVLGRGGSLDTNEQDRLTLFHLGKKLRELVPNELKSIVLEVIEEEKLEVEK